MGGLIPHAGEGEASDTRVRRSTAYCSANDRNVPVLVRISAGSEWRRRTSYHDAEQLQCLDYGVRCTGWLCPLFKVRPLPEDEISGRFHPRPQ